MKEAIVSLLLLRTAIKPIARRRCSLCQYEGYFKAYGRPVRLDARCPNCNSFERHRLLMLAIQREQIPGFNRENADVLHFAAEPIFEKIFRQRFSSYQTADLFTPADLRLDLETIAVPDSSCDIVIANHVLEHVDDHKAALELHRILRDEGIFVCQVPIIEGWEQTYEDDAIEDESGRWLHYGQGDHVRYYGRDFRSRIEAGGLRLVKEVTSEGKDVIDYGLLRGEKVFVFQKMASEP